MDRERHGLAFFPDWSSSNPYQKLLYSAVSKCGVTCKGLPGKDFTFRWIFKNRNEINFIHLHWLFAIYDPKRTGLTYLKALFFYLKLLLAKNLGYKIIWTVHNFMSHEPSNFRLEKRIRKMVSREAHAVIAHCNFAKEIIQRHWETPGDKIKVIPHGSYIGYYQNDNTRQEARRKLGIDDDCFTFLFFGMIRNYKGINPLISSFKDVKQVNPEIRLIIAGKPFNQAIKKETEKLAGGSNIHCFLEHIPDEKVQLFFNASDVVVLPYQNVLTSGAAILAFSFGKKIIAPSLGCLPELVLDGAGYLYKTESGLRDAMYFAMKEQADGGFCRSAFGIAESLNWEQLVNEGYKAVLWE